MALQVILWGLLQLMRFNYNAKMDECQRLLNLALQIAIQP